MPWRFGLLLLAAFLSACSLPQRDVAELEGACTTIHVVTRSWHSALVLPVTAIDTERLLPGEGFSDRDYIEIGWGDDAVYRNPEVDILEAAQAIFLPTEFAINVIGFHRSPEGFYDDAETLLPVALTQAELQRLEDFLYTSFARDKKGNALLVEQQRYGINSFYRGVGTYYLFNTCNNRTADALAACGIAMWPSFAMDSPNVLDQLRDAGAVGPCTHHTDSKE